MIKRPRIDKNTLKNLYIQQKLSTYKIAEIYKCHPAQIGVLLRKHGIRIRSKQQAMFIDRGVNITKSELHRLYIKGDLSTHEIAKRYNCYTSTICDYLRRYGIPTKPPKKKFIASSHELKKLYIDMKMSIRNVARKLKTSDATVTKRMKDYGITPRPLKRVLVPKKTFLNLYKKGYSLKKIGLIYNINPSALLKKARAYKINLRKSWEANIKYKKKTFNGSLTEKAYLIGFRLGDLGVRLSSERTNNIIVCSNTTKDEQVELIKRLFSKYSHIWIGKRRKNNAISVTTILNPSFSFLLPKKDSIEPWVLKNNGYMSAFIAGYTDAEGNFGIYSGRGRFRLGSCDVGILNQIDAYLRKNSIKSCLKLDRRMQKNPKYKILNKDFWRITINEKQSLLLLIGILKPYLDHKKRKRDMLNVEKNVLLRTKPEVLQFTYG